ncbi:hypothetical protein ACHWQZ_G000886 [Mnemiopsis leidyi]
MPIIRVRIPRRTANPKRRQSTSQKARAQVPSTAAIHADSSTPRTLVRTLALSEVDSEYIWNECLLLQDVHKDPDYERRVQDYTAAFQGMDNDGDGTITFEEFKQLWVKSGFLSNEGDIRILFNQVDVNGDGTISLKEFIELNERYAMPSTEEEIREAFKVFDKDNDGFITSDELKRILTKMGEPMCDEEAEEIIGYVDKNGDGKIDIDEFIVMMLKCIQDEEELDQDED